VVLNISELSEAVNKNLPKKSERQSQQVSRGCSATLVRASCKGGSDVPDVLDGAGDNEALHLRAELDIGVVGARADQREPT
jgi:hypothetical protein